MGAADPVRPIVWQSATGWSAEEILWLPFDNVYFVRRRT